MSSTLPLLLISAVLALSACAEDSLRADNDTDDADATIDDSDNTDDTDAEASYSGPSFWSLTGRIALDEGLPTLKASELQVSFFDSRGQPWQDDELDEWRCAVSVLEAVNGPIEPAEGEPLIGWWQITVDAPADAPCPWTIPTPDSVGDTELSQLVIGFGKFDGRLIPSMQAAGLDPSLDLYGLYALHPSDSGDTVYVFGVAGTDAQFSGDESTVDAPPLPSDAYELRTLVLLPVPEATQR